MEDKSATRRKEEDEDREAFMKMYRVQVSLGLGLLDTFFQDFHEDQKTEHNKLHQQR